MYLQLVEELLEDDVDEYFIYNAIFADQTTFCLNGTFNRHNSTYWSTQNIHRIDESHIQHSLKLKF